MSITSTIQTSYIASIDLDNEDFYDEIKLTKKYQDLILNTLPNLNKEDQEFNESVSEEWYHTPTIVFESLSKDRCESFIKIWEDFLKPEKTKWDKRHALQRH
jgi:hypothetical protein